MTASTPPGRPPILFLMVTAFLFSIGFALIFPVLPFIVARYVPVVSQQATVIGVLGAVYALCTFLGAPVLGALSDAAGRRVVIMLTLASSAVGYVVFGVGGSLAVLFLGRVLDGLGSGGLSALFGYVADTTPEDERGKVFGQIGAVIGAGFIIGPAVGGLLAHVSLSAPVYAAAGVCALNLLWGYFVLPESLPAEQRRPVDITHLNPLAQLSGALSLPQVRRLMMVSVLFILPLSLMQVVLSLLARDALGWGPGQVSTVFVGVGVCDIVAQGALLPVLLRRLGERGVALTGLGMGVLGMAGLALVSSLPLTALLYGGVLLFASGEGLFNAALSALLSRSAPLGAQGRVQGGASAVASLAQVVGPLGGGALYSRTGPSFTFGLGAGVVALALGLLSGRGPVETQQHDADAPSS